MRTAIVGAGLGGVAVAVGLHRAGHGVTLIEQAPDLREAGTGVVVMPNGVQALDRLGLAARLAGRSVLAHQAGLRDWRGRPLLVTDAARAQEWVGAVHVLHRAELHRLLRAPLPAEVVRAGTPVERLDVEAGGVSVISGGRVVVRADVVVVADGVGSRLRAQLFPDYPGPRRTGRLDLRGVVQVEHLRSLVAGGLGGGADVAGLLGGILVDRRSGAMFGLFPLGEGRLYWFTDSALPDVVPSPDQARDLVAGLMADWHPAVPALIAATDPADVHVDPIACLAEPLPPFAVGRIALLGDAAHAMPPDLGQGASQAFEDAAALTRHLMGADAGVAGIERRLLAYDAERRPRAQRLLRAALRQSRLTTRTGAAAWVRDGLLRAVPSRLATRRLAALWQATPPPNRGEAEW
ncbi:NAD(P)/FAD-dependent oxidoreductase [Nonomuraea sp. NPDC050310]|uniref:NAD(P)/FAD-dependent oxidoreductase n=1 Tax=Nonomuraea sp. NPDC050310 TaxID=3154935 RepID=UPI0033D7D4EE